MNFLSATWRSEKNVEKVQRSATCWANFRVRLSETPRKLVLRRVGEELEDEAQVVPPHEVVLQLDHVEFVARVGPVHQLQQTDLNLSLVQKRFLVLDDFDGHVAGLLVIVSLDDL